jgi:ABC-type uncharacterized transport system permease subunit
MKFFFDRFAQLIFALSLIGYACTRLGFTGEDIILWLGLTGLWFFLLVGPVISFEDEET